MSAEDLSPERPASAADEALLAAVQESVVKLLAEMTSTPDRVCVHAGDVSIELTWNRPASTPISVADPTPVAPDHAPTPISPTVPGGRADLPVPEGPVITAPTIGVFYTAPTPGSAPFVSVGDTVALGQQVGIIEVMKLMVPVDADRAGRITDVLIANGAPVEFGAPLFRLHGQ